MPNILLIRRYLLFVHVVLTKFLIITMVVEYVDTEDEVAVAITHIVVVSAEVAVVVMDIKDQEAVMDALCHVMAKMVVVNNTQILGGVKDTMEVLLNAILRFLILITFGIRIVFKIRKDTTNA